MVKEYKKTLSAPPKSRAVKKMKVMMGHKRRSAGRAEEERAALVKHICTTTSYKMAK